MEPQHAPNRGRVSVMLPLVPRNPEHAIPFAALVESSAAHALWQGYSRGVDALQAAAYCAGAGFRPPIGIGVLPAPLQHPLHAAQTAISLGLVTGRPVAFGIGAGSPDLQVACRGEPYDDAVLAVADYVGILRRLLDGERVVAHGGVHACHGWVDNAHLAEVEVAVGVLRPRMAAAAGRTADRAVTWLTPLDHVRETLVPAIERAARSVDRRAPLVTSIVGMAVARDASSDAAAIEAAAGGHMRSPHYRAMLRSCGTDVRGDGSEDDARTLVDHDAFHVGDPAALAATVARYWRAGVDEVVLNLAGTATTQGPTSALRDLGAILAAVDKLPPSDA